MKHKLDKNIQRYLKGTMKTKRDSVHSHGKTIHRVGDKCESISEDCEDV